MCLGYFLKLYFILACIFGVFFHFLQEFILLFLYDLLSFVLDLLRLVLPYLIIVDKVLNFLLLRLVITLKACQLQQQLTHINLKHTEELILELHDPTFVPLV